MENYIGESRIIPPSHKAAIYLVGGTLLYRLFLKLYLLMSLQKGED